MEKSNQEGSQQKQGERDRKPQVPLPPENPNTLSCSDDLHSYWTEFRN